MPSETRGGRHLTHCSLTLGFPSSMDDITRSGGGFKMSPTFHFHRKFIGLLQQQGGEWEVVTEAGVAVEIGRSIGSQDGLAGEQLQGVRVSWGVGPAIWGVSVNSTRQVWVWRRHGARSSSTRMRVLKPGWRRVAGR